MLLDRLYKILYIYHMDIIAISDFRTNLPHLIDEVSEKLKSFIVTVSGKPKAVVMSFDELESLQETAEILAISGARESIKRGLSEAKARKGIPITSLVKKYSS